MNPSDPVSYNTSSAGGRRGSFVIVILSVLFIAALAFGLQQFMKVQDYKKNTDKKIAVAVSAKTAQLQTQAQQAFDAVNTYEYKGSATYGSVSFRYPKTWSGYVDTTSTSEPINAYFNPGVVPGLQSRTAMALRVELLDSDYSQIQQQFSSSAAQGNVIAKAYVPPKMQGAANVTAGTYLTGQINNQNPDQRGAMVVIKVRDKTLEISTQSNQYLPDFNNIILAGLTFAP